MASVTMMRKATLKDYPQLIALWKKTFGDDEDIVKRLLDEFAGEGNIYVAESTSESGKRIVAQLLTVPCDAGGKKGAYLYALATDPDYRGQGIMGQLMEYAQTQIASDGYSFFVLIPASRSLFDYYESHGFDTVSLMNLDFTSDFFTQDSTLDNITNIVDDKEINNGQIKAEIFLRCRYSLMDASVVEFDINRTALELEDLWLTGFNSVYYDNSNDSTDHKEGYAIYLNDSSTLFVPEIAANSQIAAEALILEALKKTGSDRVKITLPVGSKLFSKVEEKEPIPQAQFKWWDDDKPNDLYIRFALD